LTEGDFAFFNLHSALSHPACRQTGVLNIWISVKIALRSPAKAYFPLFLKKRQDILELFSTTFDGISFDLKPIALHPYGRCLSQVT